VRKWGCFLLGRRRHLDDLPLLIARLDDPEERVVLDALHGAAMIAQIHPAGVAIPSVRKLLSHPRPTIARQAQKTLQVLGGL
jgi:hypothetical protein